jgi:hypothetical protein
MRENARNGPCISWKVTKETRGGYLVSVQVPIVTDSNCEGYIQKIIRKMDHHTLIRGLDWKSVGHIKLLSQSQKL